jgi:hypothetical protein
MAACRMAQAPSASSHRHPLHTSLFLSPVCGREAVGAGRGAQKTSSPADTRRTPTGELTNAGAVFAHGAQRGVAASWWIWLMRPNSLSAGISSLLKPKARAPNR